MSKRSLPKSLHSIPDEKTISEAYDLPVLSHDGKSTQFGKLVAPNDGIATVIVIFSKFPITPAVLSTLPLPIGPSSLVIIGCGDPSRILPYTEEISCEFPIFTDPTRRIYEKLQLNNSLHSSTRPAYTKDWLSSLIMRGARQMVWSGLGAFKGGAVSQNGGELIFRAGKCEWVHRMRSTSDHLTAEELVKVIQGYGNSHKGIET
ncbi:hypothetical protein DL98DRAFT_473886 [Cadophora sp. DSE1049]|nr:hypothetical protein DL98DRAFT_473886 [Cadophora sp. DSE1049]